jgi:hypothetical protein
MHLEARRWWSRVPLLGVTFRKRLLWENFVCFFNFGGVVFLSFFSSACLASQAQNLMIR